MGGRKERIVDVAIELFNDRGVQKVTTNHIAAALGISPGNLYYHFRNKEEVVRAVYERAIREHDEFWTEAAHVGLDPPTLDRMLERVFEHQWKYRCLQREFPVLIRHDAALAERYREMQSARRDTYRSLCRRWMAEGSMHELDSCELDDLVTTTWLVGESWLGYLEAMGSGADETEARRGARLIEAILRPHLTSVPQPPRTRRGGRTGSVGGSASDRAGA